MSARLSQALGALLLGLGLLGSGCSARDSATSGTPAPCLCDSARPVVDQALVAFLSKARAAHLRADAVEEKDPAGAVASLDAVVQGPVPPGNPPEANEVLADTRARLAELRARLGRFDEARADIEKGLGLVPDTSYFRGHLYEVLGFVEEKQAENSAKANDPAGADAARKRAVQASERAVTIQDEVIKRALEKRKP